MTMIRINEVGFLNNDTMRDSLGRLGQSTLSSGVSPVATAALVRLTCQAHGVAIAGLNPDYDQDHLKELHSLKLIHWSGDKVQMV